MQSTRVRPLTPSSESFAFSWLVHGSTEKFLVQSERVFVSLDGSLLFSHVLKEDDTTYACSLAQSSRRSGHYGPFFRLRVPPQPPRPFSPRLASSFPQLFPEQPLTRSTLYIECFAFGFPQPSYEWHRMDGRRFSSRTTVTNFGRVLRIDKATDDDAGRYKCVASNELGRVEGEVAVVLRARPSIVQPLVDTARASSEDLELVCPLATGDSSSAVEWFRNGRPIVPILMPPPLRARFSITHNSLRVRALEKKDSGVFECVASNDVGSSSSSALVWVVDEPPSFRPHTMPSRVFAIRGSSLSPTCVYVASPTGAVAWADVSGARLPTKGRRRVEGDSLVIDDVQMEDAGVFFCTAENRLGKAHHSLKLVVIEKARVVVSPGKTSGDEAVNLTCEVEVNCEKTVDCPEPLFGWNFNDRPLNLLPLKRNIKTKVHEQEKRSPSGSPLVSQSIDLEVPSSLGHKRIGRFSCTSLYGGGAADFEPRPGTPPVAVKAQNVTSHSLQLAWRAPPQHRELRHNSASGESYRVEMRTRKDRRWRALPKEVTHQGDVDSFVLTGLHPNNHYQFRVRVRTEAGLSEASSSAWVQTPPAAPSKPVENLRWTAVDGNSLLLEWDPVAEMDAGSRVKYRVSWSDKPNDELPNSFVSLVPSALLRVNSSESCRMIVIAVRPENDEGQGPLSSDTVAYLSSSGELKEAKEVKAETVNSTHANVSWVWEGAGECDAAYGVQISCTSDNSSVAAAVPAEYTHWLLGGLNPSSTYDCGLRAFDSRRRFGETTAFTLLTPRGPPSERPQIRSLALKTSSHESGYTTLIEWSPVSFDDLVNASDLNFGYKIFIYLSETSKEPIVLEMPANKLADPHMPMATVSGLKLMHLYRMQVAAYNVGGTGPPSALRSLRLGSGGQVLESTSCRARLWWLPLLFLFLLLVLH